ncbi:hypothetical protein FA95DRAFT_1606375 [Auriscalpium vulgare]|uniref:Uncharacterized protein n=1 Tax=Auriscalpium vulgare TaxID=40419 RepID=A0ACB8RSN3_9AGAM|nr:hypothetical protein FA95DRAFT_1606375 [Auriscalpium vulgare]
MCPRSWCTKARYKAALAVFNAVGKNEFEASPALECPPAIPPARTRNPSHLARQLFLAPHLTPHPFLSGAHTEALPAGPPIADVYFWTAPRWQGALFDLMPGGTVRTVALDARRCLTVCTSAGRLAHTAPGSISDTLHLGAGKWVGEWRARARRS